MIGWLAVLACGPTPTLLLAADPGRTGLDGGDGPLGVARVDAFAAARGTDRLDLLVLYPTDGQTLSPLTSPLAHVAFAQGALVDVERYLWLGVRLASTGRATVVLPRHPADLAVLEPANARASLDALSDLAHRGLVPPAAEASGSGPHRVLAGHSLGGAMAAGSWIDAGSADLVLLGAWPAEGVPAGDGGYLALVGSNDLYATPAEVEGKLQPWASLGHLGVVTGMNHFTVTDDPTDRELAADGPEDGDPALLRAAVAAALGAFLDGADPTTADLPGDVSWRY